MPNFDRTGPQGMGSRTGRGAGNCRGIMGRGKGNAAERGMAAADDLAQATEPGMGQGMGQNNGQGRCCRHGQRHNNRARNCGMNGQQANMGPGMRKRQGSGCGMGQGKGMGSANQADSSGAALAAGSDGACNNS